jgi:hypothetical protein
VRYGNDESGFTVGNGTNGESGRVVVEGWGFWDVGLAADFERATLAVCREAKRPLRVTLDLSRLRPQRDEGQEAIAKVLGTLVLLGMERAVIKAASAITKMQLMRIARATTPTGLVEFSS